MSVDTAHESEGEALADLAQQLLQRAIRERLRGADVLIHLEPDRRQRERD